MYGVGELPKGSGEGRIGVGEGESGGEEAEHGRNNLCVRLELVVFNIIVKYRKPGYVSRILGRERVQLKGFGVKRKWENRVSGGQTNCANKTVR